MVIDNADHTHEADRLASFSEESAKESLDRLSRLAAALVGAPMAFISVKGHDGRLCIGQTGLPEAWVSQNDDLFEQLAGLPTPLVIADAREHGLLHDHPALRDIGAVACVCLPLRAPDNQTLGTLSVIDTGRRDWTGDDMHILTDLAITVMRERGLCATVSVTEQALRATIDALPLPAALLDPDGKILSWNTTAERMLGWQESEVIGRSCPAVPDGQRDIYNMLFARAIQGEALVDMEIQRRKRDGGRLDLNVLLSPMRDAGGRVSGVISIFADISALKRAEEEARRNEIRFQALIEHSTDGVALLGEDGVIRYASPSTSPTLGYAPEEFAGRNVFDGVHPDDRDRLARTFAQALSEPGVRFFEQYRYRHKDGSWIWMESTGTNLLNEPGVWGIVASYRDITKRKQGEAELRARARQQAAVARLGQRALADIDLDSLLAEAVTLITQTLDVEFVKLLELLPDGDTFLLRAGAGWRAGLVGQTTVGAGINSQAGYALLRGETVVVEDLGTEPRFDAPPLLRSHHVVSGVSTIIGDPSRPFGVLGVHTATRREFTPDSIHFLQAVASVLAAAVERKQAEAALVRRGRQLEILSRASQEVNSVLEIPVIMRTMVASGMELVGAAAGTYGLPVDGKLAFTEYLEGSETRSIDVVFEPGSGVPGWVMETRSPYVSSDLAVDPHVLPELHRGFGIRNLVSVPILSRTGELLGCFELHNKREGRTFHDDDLALLQGLASSAAVALENAQLYRQAREAEEASRRYAARVDSLAKASRIFAEAGHDLSVITETITRLVGDLLGDSCGIHLFSGDGQHMISSALYNPDEEARAAFWKLIGAHPMRTDRGLTSRLLRTGEPLLIPDLDLEKLRGVVALDHFAYLERFGLRSLIVVPLRVQGRIIGMLDLARYRTGA
ncbi:GAF domain-containing protein, partial [Nitrolancea hollandica]|uniref:GAF domain-containing protein n=1 Tax=Nitrolancea hollandica TaxID=1206749 RepID=UPI00058B2DB1